MGCEESSILLMTSNMMMMIKQTSSKIIFQIKVEKRYITIYGLFVDETIYQIAHLHNSTQTEEIIKLRQL
jgi:hypothetical protein